MRILTLLHDLAPGGSERVALSLAAEWRKAGAEAALLLISREGSAAVPPDVPVVPLAGGRPRSLLSRFRIGRPLAEAVGKLAPDILFLPGNWHFALARGAAAATPRPLIVGKLSNPPVPPGVPLAGAAFRALTAPIDAFGAWPPAAAAGLERLAGGRPIARIPNPPIDGTPVAPAPARPSGPRLLVAGRLVRQKRVELALQALAGLPGIALDIAGDGPERARLEALARRLGIAERVAFHGHVRAIGPLLAAADALLLPSRFEGTPAVVLEALAARVPVVATACSELLPLVLDRPGRGRIVPEASPRAFAAAIRAQLATAGDMGDIAAALAPYRRADVAAAWLGFFRELLRQR
ncbi:glycosyltransferase [Thermaurantiacus sp.]